MATVYWAWTWPTGDRRCYKQFFDPQCFASVVTKINAADNNDLCFMCGQLAATDQDLNLYATYYVPKHDRADAFLSIHEACLSQGDQYFMQNAIRMPNRQEHVTPPSREHPKDPWDSWDSMGLRRA